MVSGTATSSTRVVVAFNEPMADSALAPQHYTLQEPTGVAGPSPTARTIFQSVSATSNVIGQVRVHNTGPVWRRSPTGGSTGPESRTPRARRRGTSWPGRPSTHNPGGQGVPNGVTFHPVMRAVAGKTVTPIERFTHVFGPGVRRPIGAYRGLLARRRAGAGALGLASGRCTDRLGRRQRRTVLEAAPACTT